MSDARRVKPVRAGRPGRDRPLALAFSLLLLGLAMLPPVAGGQSAGGLLDNLLGIDAPPDEPPGQARDHRGHAEREDEDDSTRGADGAAPEAASSPEMRLPSAPSAVKLPRWGSGLASVGFGFVGLALLGVAVGLGRLAGRPRRPRLAAREAGRQRALREAPLDGDGAVVGLRAQRFGAVVESRHDAASGAEVAVKRRRRTRCEEIEGYLAGAFESAWGADVAVDHWECGGRARRKPCRFAVRAVRRKE